MRDGGRQQIPSLPPPRPLPLRRGITPVLPAPPAQQKPPPGSSGPLASLGLINEEPVSLFQAVRAHYRPGPLGPVPRAGNGTAAGGSKATGVPLQRGRII